MRGGKEGGRGVVAASSAFLVAAFDDAFGWFGADLQPDSIINALLSFPNPSPQTAPLLNPYLQTYAPAKSHLALDCAESLRFGYASPELPISWNRRGKAEGEVMNK